MYYIFYIIYNILYNILYILVSSDSMYTTQSFMLVILQVYKFYCFKSMSMSMLIKSYYGITHWDSSDDYNVSITISREKEKIKRNVTMQLLLIAFVTLIFTLANIYQSFPSIRLLKDMLTANQRAAKNHCLIRSVVNTLTLLQFWYCACSRQRHLGR